MSACPVRGGQPRSGAGLATPLLLLLILVQLDYEPPFMSLLNEPDGTPNTIGRAFMMAVLLSVIGLVINLLPRLRRPTGKSTRFTPPQHTSSSDSWCSVSYSSSPPTLA